MFKDLFDEELTEEQDKNNNSLTLFYWLTLCNLSNGRHL